MIEVDPTLLEKSKPQEVCEQLIQMVRLARKSPAQVDCRVRPTLGASSGLQIQGELPRDQYRYVFAYRQQDLAGALQFSVENPRGNHEGLDFEVLHWSLNRATPLKQRVTLQKVLNQFFELDSDERYFKEFLLARGVSESKEIELSPSGQYIYRATGEPMTFDHAYEQFLSESRRNRSWIRAITEIAVTLGGGGLWYYRNKELNAEDWEYSPDWEGFRKKMTQGILFDTNSMWLNSPGHPVAGSFYYGFARSNGFSAFESLLMAFAASAVWEMTVEYREVLSINDMIFTPIAGAAIGEAMHQLKLLFARSKGGWVRDVFLSIFGGAGALDYWINSNKPPRAKSLDSWGFPDDIGHRIDVWAGAGFQVDDGSRSSATGTFLSGFQGDVTNVPGYARASNQSRIFWDTTATRLGLDLALSGSELEILQFYVQAAWAGYHHQEIVDESGQNEGGRLSGYSFLVGPASGYRHSIRKFGTNESDEMAVVNVLGPSMEVIVFTGRFKIKLNMDVFGDFAAVHSFAVEDYERLGGDLSSAKSVLELRHYYYAFGMTAHGAAQVEVGPLELGFDFVHQTYSSIQGFDSAQEELTDDFPLQDEQSVAKVWLAARTPVERLKVILSLERLKRSGSLDPADRKKQSSSTGQTIGTLKLLYEF